jgi:hypothetical protein
MDSTANGLQGVARKVALRGFVPNQDLGAEIYTLLNQCSKTAAGLCRMPGGAP